MENLLNGREATRYFANLLFMLLLSIGGLILLRVLRELYKSFLGEALSNEKERQSVKKTINVEHSNTTPCPPALSPLHNKKSVSDPGPLSRRFSSSATTRTSVRVTQTTVNGSTTQETVVSVHTQIGAHCVDVEAKIQQTELSGSSASCFWRPWYDIDQHIRFGYFEDQGGRTHMENRCTFCPNFDSKSKSTRPQSCAVLLDGHAGVEAAEWVQTNVLNVIAEHVARCDNIRTALKEAFINADQLFCNYAVSHDIQSGAVGVVVLIEEDKLYVANVGDCKAVLCSNGQYRELTETHVLKCEKEKARVLAENGQPAWETLTRSIEVTRAFGDLMDGNKICGLTAQPFVQEYDLDPNAEFLIIGCDGFWDGFQTVKQAGTECRRKLRNCADPYSAAKHIVEIAKTRSDDNISALVVAFPKHDPETQTLRVGPRLDLGLSTSRLRLRHRRSRSVN